MENNQKNNQKKKSDVKKIWIIILAIVLMCSIMLNFLMFIILFTLNDNASKVDNETIVAEATTKTTTKTTEATTTTTKELTSSEKMKLKISELFNTGLAFDAGDYAKGDIPEGEYAFVKFSERQKYYCEKDGAGEILDNENFDSFGYVHVHAMGNLKTDGVLINVNAFEQLEVSSAKEIYELLNDKTDYMESGYYKIGVDIPAGEYSLRSVGHGYWAIMTGPVSDAEIVDNDGFDGSATVKVKDGQYLKLSRVVIDNK